MLGRIHLPHLRVCKYLRIRNFPVVRNVAHGNLWIRKFPVVRKYLRIRNFPVVRKKSYGSVSEAGEFGLSAQSSKYLHLKVSS